MNRDTRDIKDKKVKCVIDWVLINFIVPLILPLLFALCVSLFYVKINMNVLELFELLLQNGVYTFLGLTVLISLFQDYRDVPQAYTLPIYGGVFIFFLIIGFIFLSSLELIPKENAVSYQENIDAFIMATIGITSLSVLLKYKIIKIKYRET